MITNSGGQGGGPALSIVNRKLGTLDSPVVKVVGQELHLSREECAAGGDYSFVSSVFRWQLTGRTLRLTTVSNGCRDRIDETILTSLPWKRTAK